MGQHQPSEPISASGEAFDHVAARYDVDATNVELSRWLRVRVWERLAGLFKSGDRVLEIGCGTGEDAIWLAKRGIHVTASDASAAMLAEARRKARQEGVGDLIELRQLDLARAAAWDVPNSAYDGVTSNFGPV